MCVAEYDCVAKSPTDPSWTTGLIPDIIMSGIHFFSRKISYFTIDMATAAEQATPQEIDLRNSLNAEKRKSSLGAMSDFADTARMIAAQRKQSQLQHGTADATAGSTLQQTAADRGNAEQNLGNATKQHQPGQPQGNFSSASLARREQPEEPEPDMEDEETSEAYNEMLAEVGESQQKQSKADKLNAVKSAASQDRASYSPMTFVVMLGLAVTKDSLDVGTAELFSWADWILDWILAFILFFLMMGRGGTRFKLKMARVALVFFFSSAKH